MRSQKRQSEDQEGSSAILDSFPLEPHNTTLISPASGGLDHVNRTIQALKSLLNTVMVRDRDYGIIPGCQKPCLLLPGAELLMLMFNLRQKITRNEVIDLAGGHRMYTIGVCICDSRGNHVCEAEGVASTLETKWRYRWENTGERVPQQYWEKRDPSILGGPDRTPRKVRIGQTQVWVIYHRVEHDNPADYYNTVLAMAHKRAFVRAVRSATAASTVFEVEMEDAEINGNIPRMADHEDQKRGRGGRSGARQTRDDPAPPPPTFITDRQRRELVDAMTGSGLTQEDLFREFGVRSTALITESTYDQILQWARSTQAGEARVTGNSGEELWPENSGSDSSRA